MLFASCRPMDFFRKMEWPVWISCKFGNLPVFSSLTRPELSARE